MIFKRKKNVLVVGKNGMLGREVYEALVRETQLARSTIGHVDGTTKDILDITNYNSVVAYFGTNRKKYDYVINCAAMTDTVSAETEREALVSYEVNALGCRHLAEVCEAYGMRLIHISTDYVFSDTEYDVESHPHHRVFLPESDPFPVNRYGIHKLLGEQFIQSGMSGGSWTILRTSWLYGRHGNKSFAHKLINRLVGLHGSGERRLEMVTNDYSIPTSTDQLTSMILNTLKHNITGIHHAVAYSAYPVSRFEYAKRIIESLRTMPSAKDLVKDAVLVPVKSITHDIPRPVYSVLSVYPDNCLFRDIGVSLEWDIELDRFVHGLDNYVICETRKV